MNPAELARSILLVGLVAGCATACTSTTPTIAHTHIGHAITAFDGTPEDVGLFVLAEERAEEALRHADVAVRDSATTSSIQSAVDDVLASTASADYGLRKAVAEAESHVTFAANSEDASSNVKTYGQEFARGAEEVLGRCDLIALLSADVLRSSDEAEIDLLTRRIHDLAYANVHGGVSATGEPFAPGTKQLREVLDAMVTGEDPPYVTVDRWYLFHLVRLPDCDNCWAWRKWANSSNRGY